MHEFILQSLADVYRPTGQRVHVCPGDVLKFPMQEVFSDCERREWYDVPPNTHIVGNLPFNVSTPLIIQWLRDISSQQGAWR